MPKELISEYADSIGEVIDYIHSHLDDEITVEQLSKIAGFSKFHFHRQFTSYAGITVAKLVQLLRLKRASFQLVFNRSYSITDIAFDAAYESSESFSRAFKKAFGQTPSEFRFDPAWQPWREVYKFQHQLTGQTMKVEIVDFEETKVAALEHKGSPKLVYDTTRKFIEWRKENGITPESGKTYGIHYTDERTVPPEEYRLDICISVEEEIGDNSYGVVMKTIPAGRCAKIRHLGSREHIEAAVYIYEQWLPNSGEKLRDFPVFFHYVNVGPDVEEHTMITDVYLPII